MLELSYLFGFTMRKSPPPDHIFGAGSEKREFCTCIRIGYTELLGFTVSYI